MTSKDIADALAAAHGIGNAEARAMVATMLDTIASGLAKGDVALAGFGKFAVSNRPRRAGRHPRTGEPMIIAASKAVKFRPALALKNRVAG